MYYLIILLSERRAHVDSAGLAMNTDYTWQKYYQEAVLETDDSRLRERVDAAQTAIDARLYELSLDGKDAGQERIAIQNALKGLVILRKERQRSS
jgi:hypothetical protein